MSFNIHSNIFCKYLTNNENIITATASASACDNDERIAYNLAFYYARKIAYKEAKKIAKKRNEKIVNELEVTELNDIPKK